MRSLLITLTLVLVLSGCAVFIHPVAENSKEWTTWLGGNWLTVDPKSGEQIGHFTVSFDGENATVSAEKEPEVLHVRGEKIRDTLFLSLKRAHDLEWMLIAVKREPDADHLKLYEIPADELASAIKNKRLIGTVHSDSPRKITIRSESAELMTFLEGYTGPLEIITHLQRPISPSTSKN